MISVSTFLKWPTATTYDARNLFYNVYCMDDRDAGRYAVLYVRERAKKYRGCVFDAGAVFFYFLADHGNCLVSGWDYKFFYMGRAYSISAFFGLCFSVSGWYRHSCRVEVFSCPIFPFPASASAFSAFFALCRCFYGDGF